MKNSKEICHAALGGAILCLIAPISIPVGTIPITLSLLAVLLISAVLPAKTAFLSLLCYVALGAVGAPVFAGFIGGFQIISGPTGGFILGYLPAAFLVPLGRKSKAKTAFFMVISTIICYFIGSVWLSRSTESNFFATLITTALSCAIPDGLKITAAVFSASAVNKRIGRA